MRDRPAVTAILGPTNTGKTHLAVERLMAHSSGVIGFPLRLLAREIYERVAAIKGKHQVALVTGEEKIVPAGARWTLCTAESMPTDVDAAFLALDEAQLGADPERGHVFTDRILRARGREETLILGSESLRPMVRALVPEAEIVTRPRFSTLSYAGAKKLSRIPPRSAIVAFSAEEVYAIAEMLRRARGGAAVVMGALSPRTRNAQVAMFQAGEVDYLVATDAIGMGLNLDLAHVAFAGLAKFDGRRRRRLSLAEMAQIAGRAGRHQRDGTFGTLGPEEGGIAFNPEEIERIEEHRFPALERLYWREGKPALSSVDALIAALEAPPRDAVLTAAPEAVDLAVLKRLAGQDWVRDCAHGPAMVARLWAACGLPDFRKTGADTHAQLAGRLFRHLSEGAGHVPVDWIAAELARLDQTGGDVETLAGRIAAARTWAYVAHRRDWLADSAHWAARSEALEERLSDALHAALTQRFVDRRTTVLMREIGRDPDAVAVTIAEDGAVSIDDEPIGRLEGFRFHVLPEARSADRRRMLAVAERRLVKTRSARAAALAAAPDTDFALEADPIGIAWRGWRVARLEAGATLLEPRVKLDAALDALDEAERRTIKSRLDLWLGEALANRLAPLAAIAAAARDAAAPQPLRALLAPLAAAGGVVDRRDLIAAIDALAPEHRRAARALGVTIGALDVFAPALLKPEAMRWRAALAAVRAGADQPAVPPPGVVLTAPTPLPDFRTLGGQALRVDLVERLAREAHESRGRANARLPFALDAALATSLGLSADGRTRLLRQLGFEAEGEAWRWRGRVRPKPAPPKRDGAFAGLSALVADAG